MIRASADQWRRQLGRVGALLLALVACRASGVSGARNAAPPDARMVPSEHYETLAVEGFTVRVNRSLRRERRELGDRALRLLEVKLFDVSRAVPPKALAVLRGVPIWLGVDDGTGLCAEYHGGPEWLRDNGHNPDKAWSVEIGNAERFLDWTQAQPSMLMHELAHAYFDRLPPGARRQVEAAFASAPGLGIYANVLHAGGGRVRHYGLTDVGEFFAEASEAFFGTNDHFPFVRAELWQHHPALAEALAVVWSLHDGPTLKTEPTGQRAVRLRPLEAGAAPPPSRRSTRALELGVFNASAVDFELVAIDPEGHPATRKLFPAGSRALVPAHAGQTFVLEVAGERRAFLSMPGDSGRVTVLDEHIRSPAE